MLFAGRLWHNVGNCFRIKALHCDIITDAHKNLRYTNSTKEKGRKVMGILDFFKHIHIHAGNQLKRMG